MKDESLETKKKKKKKKKNAKPPLQNETADENIDRKKFDKNSSSLTSSNEVLYSPANNSCDEEGTVSMELDSSDLHIASTAQPVTDFQEVKPQVQLITVCKSVTSTDYYITEGNSLCDFPLDTSEESSMPSARAVSVALQTSIIPLGDAEGSRLAEAAGNCHFDIRDSMINIGPVLESSDSDSQAESIHTSELDDEKGISECNNLRAEVEISHEEEVIQTQQCDLVKVIKQEAINENVLLRQTDGENNDKRFGNFNYLNISLCKTDEPYFVSSAKERDSGVSEESSISVATYNTVKTFHESSKVEHRDGVAVTHDSKSAELTVHAEENVVTVDDSRLVNKNNGVRLEEEQNQFQNERERIDYSPGTNKNSPLIELDSFKFGESENFVDEQPQNNDECVTRSKEVREILDRSGGEAMAHDVTSLLEDELILSMINENFGVKCTTEEEKRRHATVKSHCTEETVEDGNLTLKVSAPFSQFKLNTADPVKAQNENIYRPAGNFENTRGVEHLESREQEAIEIAVSEHSNSVRADNGLADKETSLFNFTENTPASRLGEGGKGTESCEKVEIFSSSCATAETSETAKMHLPSSSTKQDPPFCPNEEAKGTSMAVDIATESFVKGHMSKSTLGGVSEGVDIIQHFTKHAAACTQQVPEIATSNHDILSEEGKRSNRSCICLELSASVSGEHFKRPETSSKKNQVVLSDPQCSILDLNSDKLLDKDDEEVSLNGHTSVRNRDENKCQLIVSKEFGQYDVEQNSSPLVHEQSEKIPAKQQIRISQTGQIKTQFNEAEVDHDCSVRNKGFKPDGGESLNSLQSRCRSSSSCEGIAETFVHVNDKRDITSSCDVENLPAKENGVNIDSETLASNSTSEESTMKSEGKVIPPMNGTELICDNLKTVEQSKDQTGVPFTNRIDESKQRVDEEKEEGEISSDEDDTSKTQKPAEKEREEGELSSSDSDVEGHGEVSSHEQQGGASLLRSKHSDDKNVLSRKERRLCPTRQHSSSGLPQKLSKVKGREPENSRSDKRASLSSFKNTDFRRNLSEARRTRPALKGRSTSISDARDGRVHETRPVEKRAERNGTAKRFSASNGNEEGTQPRKGTLNPTKVEHKTNVKSSKLQQGSQGKRKETGQRVTATSDESKPGSKQRRNETNNTKGKSNISLQGNNVKVKKTNPTSSRHKTEDRSVKPQLDPKKIAKKSTDVTEDKKITRKLRRRQGKESKVKLKPSVTKTTSSFKGEDKITAKDSHTLSKAKSETPARDTKEKIKLNPSAKVFFPGSKTNKHPSESSFGSSKQPHSGNETTAKKATVLTNHSEGDNKNDKESKKASSQGKVQNKDGRRSKAKDETKPVDASVVVKRGCSEKAKLTRAKTTIKVSPQITPRKALKKLPSSITSKAKVHSQRGNKDRAENPRKRPRAVDVTEVREIKRLRLEVGNNYSSKLPNHSSTSEISKPSTKRGENNNDRENQPPPLQLNASENKIITALCRKLKSADEHICLDNSKKNSNEIDGGTLSKRLFIGRNKRLVFKHRHVNQLFIRGDNVVMVAYVN